jgi:hypothetical protein
MKGYFFILSAVLFLFHTRATYSQSLIVGVPNAEVMPQGRTLLAHESQLNTWQFGEAKWTSFNFACYGIGFNTELCMTLFNVSRPASGNLTLAAGFKSAFPILHETLHDVELMLTFGQMLPVSLDGQGVGTWTFGTASFRLPFLKTRLTAGPSYGTRQIFGRDLLCVMLGFEQPITEQVSLIGDWYSGTHDIAALIAAIQYDPNPHLTIIAGYKIPNNAVSGFHAAMLEVTVEF